ncbi:MULTISPECIES: hypothetical protein [Sphingomonas]|uniref:hypothetical protein n=1 Tax=Sphingomonas TaxID=13687 RepID=UPI000F7E3BBA|nr:MULTISPECIES: hypothetical protein [Sphingomonas]RSV22275.1 hypothetical protein CA237_15355 [Sphingomonas sp. ABOLH]
MIDEESARQGYDELRAALRKASLEWIAEQVEQAVSLGKPVTKEADASEFIDDQVVGQRRGRKRLQEFVTTEPYSCTERLRLLLDAIERVTALPAFEREALAGLDAQKVTFVSEQDGELNRDLQRDRSLDQDATRHRVQELLQETRRALA